MVCVPFLCVPHVAQQKTPGQPLEVRATSKSPPCHADDASVQEGNSARFCLALRVHAP